MRPSFRTICNFRTFSISAKGLSATTIRSASLPGSTVPNSEPTPHISAAFLVAAISACACGDCGQTTTGIRRLRLTDVPQGIAADQAEVDGHGRLALVWPDGRKRYYARIDQCWTDAQNGNMPIHEAGAHLEYVDDDGSSEWNELQRRAENEGPVFADM